MKYNRIFLVIMDSVGAGELPDAKDYNDTGANTLKHIAQTAKGLNMPHMQALGLGNLTEIEVWHRFDLKKDIIRSVKSYQ